MIHIDGKIPPELELRRKFIKDAAAFFADRSSRRIGIPFNDVTVIVQNDVQSAEAHDAIMDIPDPTDVITQRYDPMPGEPDGVYGEVYVNADQAIRFVSRMHRKPRGWSAASEFLLYVAHGMDHLSGADDHTPTDYSRMRRRELRWLRDFRLSANVAF